MFAEYKVINIIDKFALIIDYGSLDGAKVGDDVRIYTKGEEIFDLNKSSLGHIEMIKDELEIIEVFDRFSICKKIIIKQRNALQPIQFIKTTKTEQELKVDETILSHYRYYDTSDIEIGDSIKILKL